MLTTSYDDRHSRAVLELEICGNAERSDFNDALCGRLLVAELTVRTFSPTGFSIVRSLTA